MLYTSEVTGKSYKTVKELEAAEKEVAEQKAKEEAEKESKKAELAVLNEKASSYLKLVEKNNVARKELKAAEDEAYAAFRKELDDFAKKHNGYHLTYKVDGTNVEYKIEESRKTLLEDAADYSNNFMRDFFEIFFN